MQFKHLHIIYKPIQEDLKDYVDAKAKYVSITSYYSNGKRRKNYLSQIRTFEMHKTAKYGIAAHWKYKEGNNSTDSKDVSLENKLGWLNEILEWQINF